MKTIQPLQPKFPATYGPPMPRVPGLEPAPGPEPTLSGEASDSWLPELPPAAPELDPPDAPAPLPEPPPVAGSPGRGGLDAEEHPASAAARNAEKRRQP